MFSCNLVCQRLDSDVDTVMNPGGKMEMKALRVGERKVNLSLQPTGIFDVFSSFTLIHA